MILSADSEGPDQTARKLRCPHKREQTFSHCAAHIRFLLKRGYFNRLNRNTPGGGVGWGLGVGG